MRYFAPNELSTKVSSVLHGNKVQFVIKLHIHLDALGEVRKRTSQEEISKQGRRQNEILSLRYTTKNSVMYVVKAPSIGELFCCGHCNNMASNNQTNFVAFQAQLFCIKHSYYSKL